MEGAAGVHADAVFDHQVGEPLAVDQDHFLVEAGGVLLGVFVEAAGGDEDAFGGFLAGERADEVLDLGAADVVLPALGLDVDDVEAEAVFVDDAVDAFVVGLLGDGGGFLARAAVAHFDEEIEDDLLEAEGIDGGQLGEQIGDQGFAQFGEGGFDSLLGGGLPVAGGGGFAGVEGFGGGGARVALLLLEDEFFEGLELHQGLLVETQGRILQELLAFGGDAQGGLAGKLGEAGFAEVEAGPAEAVAHGGGLAAGEHPVAFFFAELKDVGHLGGKIALVMFLAVGQQFQQRKRHFVVVGDAHKMVSLLWQAK